MGSFSIIFNIALLCFTANVGLSYALYQTYTYDTYYFKQKVDHFSFSNLDKFSQRYLVSNKDWNKKGGPIFFYAGNEGDITLFAQNTGFMWEIAPQYSAMVIFAEHRYYGKSLPYGKRSFLNTTYSGYLTSEQALADYADLITFIKTSVEGALTSPVIAFGGSYGGMLAAWFRMKYPHIINGAIAASAPIWQFIDMTPCDKFGKLVTKDFQLQSDSCANVIRNSWGHLNKMSKTEDGRKWINKNWKLCSPMKEEGDIQNLKEYLINVWTNLAMADYPYPASFLAPLPANPIKMVCDNFKHPEYNSEDLLRELFDGVSIYFNFTKTAPCLDYTEDATSLLGDEGWDFQACTEMIMPFCYDGKADFFELSPWNFTQFSQNCYKKWRVMPRPLMPKIQYGGRNIAAASNIVFSNGLLDPWSTGGVMTNLSSTLIAVIIPEGAHHLDLRQSDPNDPPSVVIARNIERNYITKWINDANQNVADHGKVAQTKPEADNGKVARTKPEAYHGKVTPTKPE